MKVKRIQIGIKSLDETLKEAGEVFEQAATGKAVKRRSAVYFSTITEMRRVLTEKRLELIKVIKDRKPSSVYELAKFVHRDLKNVLQDLAYLKQLGLVEVTETADKKVPAVHFDKIAFEVAI
jgi:predicted transcriptional regulator